LLIYSSSMLSLKIERDQGRVTTLYGPRHLLLGRVATLHWQPEETTG
jgi:hypothetical protein